MLSISYFNIYSSIATMSSCHSFYSNSNENEFQEKDNRHPKDQATAVTGSRSFSGTFSSCSLLCACELSHSKKASPHDTHDQICLTLNMSHSERIQRTIPSWSNALFPQKQKKHCHAQGFCSMYISPSTKKSAPITVLTFSCLGLYKNISLFQLRNAKSRKAKDNGKNHAAIAQYSPRKIACRRDP